MTEYYTQTSRTLSDYARANTLPPADIPLTPVDGGGMSIGESALQIGDIIVSTTSSPVSSLIRRATNSKVSHAALYAGNGQVIEAINGVEIRTLEAALADDDYAVAFTDPGLSEAQRQQIRDFAAGQLGQSYDFVAIAKHGLHRLSSSICGLFSGDNRSACETAGYLIAFGNDDDDRWYCSELIFAAYEHAGASLGVPAHVGRPDTLVNLGDRLVYVGHLKTPESALGGSQSLRPTQTWRSRSASISLSAGALEVDVKLRMFIPSPAIGMTVPVVGTIKAFGGDGRSFSYSSGTHRGVIHCKVRVGVGDIAPQVNVVSKDWGASTEYDTNDVIDVPGQPDWYKDKRADAAPIASETLAVTDDNLSVELGGTSTFHNVHAYTSESTIIQLHAAGGNPLLAGSPDIDAHLNVYLRVDGTDLKCLVLGRHDGFPAYELYINEQRVHHYDPVAAGASPTALFGGGDIDVDTAWLSLGPVATGLGLVSPMNRDLARTQFKLNIHRDITERAAQQAGVDATVAMLFGSNWPDVPIDGSPWGALIPAVGVINSLRNLHASHLGEQQVWHSMAPRNDMTNGQVLENIIQQAREWWAENDDFHIGAILHTVQDSYSMSHVVRRRNGNVAGFQNFTEQDRDLHGEADLNQVSASEAVPASSRILELYRDSRPFADVEAYLRNTVYKFEGNAANNQIIGTLDSYRAQCLRTVPAQSAGVFDAITGVVSALLAELRAKGVDEQEATSFIDMLQNPTPASAAAMTAGTRAFSDNGITITLPGGQVLDGWKRDVFITLMKAAIRSSGAGTLLGVVFPEALLALCDRLNITVGIGPAVSGGLGGGGSLGAGILFAPGNRIGFYGSGAGIVGYIDSLSAAIQLTVVHGGPDVFGGSAYVVGGTVDLSEGPGVGIHALFNAQGGDLIGVTGELTFSLGVPAVSAIEGFAQYQHTTTTLAMGNVHTLPMNAMTPEAQARAIGAQIPLARESSIEAVGIGVSGIIAVSGNSADISWDIQSLDARYHPHHDTFTDEERRRYMRQTYNKYDVSPARAAVENYLWDEISASVRLDYWANGTYVGPVTVHEPSNINDAWGWDLHISSRIVKTPNVHTKGDNTRIARVDVIVTWQFGSITENTETLETTYRIYANGEMEYRTVWDENFFQIAANQARDRASTAPRATPQSQNKSDTGWLSGDTQIIESAPEPPLPANGATQVASLSDYRKTRALMVASSNGNGSRGRPTAIGGLSILPSGNYQQIGGLPILSPDHYGAGLQAAKATPAPLRQVEMQPGSAPTVVAPAGSQLARTASRRRARQDPMQVINPSRHQYQLCMRAFAPWESFGLGFEGDNRTFSTSPYDTFRTGGFLVFDVDSGEVTEEPRGFSSGTRRDEDDAMIFANVNATVTDFEGGGPVRFTFSTEGSNPMVPGSPNLDLTLVFAAFMREGNLFVAGELIGDGFPNAEVFIRDHKGNAFMLTQFQTSHGPNTGPFTLTGAGTERMGRFQLGIMLDEENSIVGSVPFAG